jgi:hypothetical protein
MLPEGVWQEGWKGLPIIRRAMHCIVSFAAPLSDAGQAALQTLQLPSLAALRERLGEVARDDAHDEWSLSPPHERAYAQAAGWQGVDGSWPFATQEAARLGLPIDDLPWACLTPTHWKLGTEQLSLLDPAQLALDEAASRTLFDAVKALLEADGWQAHWGRADAWFVAHGSLHGLPMASLDRVIGRNVDAWLGSNPALRPLRRLQAELQMLLHSHPLNAEREARGLLPVNSVWASGGGVQQPVRPGADIRVEHILRSPALNEDWAAWCKAWQVLDAGRLAELLQRVLRGEDVELTLCGERGSVTLGGAPRRGFGRWMQRWGQSPLAEWLGAL